MRWIDRRIEADRAAEQRENEARRLSTHGIELLRQQIPVLWRAVLIQCEDAVETFNREFRSDRIASLRKEGENSVQVELHRPGSALMTARLVVDGYRIDYTLYRDGKPVEQVTSKITFELAADSVFLSGEGKRLDADGACRLLLEPVLFGPPAQPREPTQLR
jgi:hypothetical protein